MIAESSAHNKSRSRLIASNDQFLRVSAIVMKTHALGAKYSSSLVFVSFLDTKKAPRIFHKGNFGEPWRLALNLKY